MLLARAPLGDGLPRWSVVVATPLAEAHAHDGIRDFDEFRASVFAGVSYAKTLDHAVFLALSSALRRALAPRCSTSPKTRSEQRRSLSRQSRFSEMSLGQYAGCATHSTVCSLR